MQLLIDGSLNRADSNTYDLVAHVEFNDCLEQLHKSQLEELLNVSDFLNGLKNWLVILTNIMVDADCIQKRTIDA